MKSIAVVIPVYNEEKAIQQNFARIHEILTNDGLNCHYMLVDDGSKDGTWNQIEQIKKQYARVSAVKFSRNFGKEMAVRAGLDNIDADIYVTMDSDLQHPPKHIRPMIELLNSSGASIVNGKKKSRGRESLLYKFFAKSFYSLLYRASGLDIRGSSDFKVVKRQVVDQIRKMTEQNIFYRGIVDWIGFDSVDYMFDVESRLAGTGSFSFGRLMTLALSAISSHTAKPLLITVYLGIFFLIFALILAVQTLVNFFTNTAISGFTTVIMLQLLVGASIMICLGLIANYVARIYEEVKGRPPYIVERKL